MDLPWLRPSLRETLREILEVGNSYPFRGYYAFVAHELLKTCGLKSIDVVYELGAGTAPISRHMNAIHSCTTNWPKKICPCDLNPDIAAFEICQKTPGGHIFPIYKPINYFSMQPWQQEEGKSLLVFSATLHHIPSDQRVALLRSILPTCDMIYIAEPLRRSVSSLIFVFLSLIPAVLVPIVHWKKPGKATRIFWCWIVPIAPILFLWDGLVSALRQWTGNEWHQALFTELSLSQEQVKICQTQFSTFVEIDSRRRNGSALF